MNQNNFNKDQFLNYLEKIHQIDCDGIEIIDNLINYGLKKNNQSPDEFAEFISEVINEIDFEEVAAFCSDSILTPASQIQKKDYINYMMQEY